MNIAEQIDACVERAGGVQPLEHPGGRLEQAEASILAFARAFDCSPLPFGAPVGAAAVRSQIHYRLIAAVDGLNSGPDQNVFRQVIGIGPNLIGDFVDMLPRLVLFRTGARNPHQAKAILASENFYGLIRKVGSLGAGFGDSFKKFIQWHAVHTSHREVFRFTACDLRKGIMEQHFEIVDGDLRLTEAFLSAFQKRVDALAEDFALDGGHCPALRYGGGGKSVFEQVTRWVIAQYLEHGDFACGPAVWGVGGPWLPQEQRSVLASDLGLDGRLYAHQARWWMNRRSRETVDLRPVPNWSE